MLVAIPGLQRRAFGAHGPRPSTPDESLLRAYSLQKMKIRLTMYVCALLKELSNLHNHPKTSLNPKMVLKDLGGAKIAQCREAASLCWSGDHSRSLGQRGRACERLPEALGTIHLWREENPPEKAPGCLCISSGNWLPRALRRPILHVKRGFDRSCSTPKQVDHLEWSFENLVYLRNSPKCCRQLWNLQLRVCMIHLGAGYALGTSELRLRPGRHLQQNPPAIRARHRMQQERCRPANEQPKSAVAMAVVPSVASQAALQTGLAEASDCPGAAIPCRPGLDLSALLCFSLLVSTPKAQVPSSSDKWQAISNAPMHNLNIPNLTPCPKP